MNEQRPQDRITYSGDLSPVFTNVCQAFDVGAFRDFRIVSTGYEDFNVVLRTDNGLFLAKIFAAYRREEDIDRYQEIMNAVTAAGVSHPHMYTSDNRLVLQDHESGLSMVVMDYITGETLYDIGKVPNDADLQAIMREAVKINNITFKPPFLDDGWSIAHISKTYDIVQDFLMSSEREVVTSIINAVESIDTTSLPHCFVHGDIIKSNVLLERHTGKVYILDFSVANWYPRIQELAVIAGSLLNDPNATEDLNATLAKVMHGYVSAGGELTDKERDHLPVYTRAAYVMEFLGATKEKFVNSNDSSENDYWLELGRSSLMRTA